jgi:hypothetical protein
MSPIYQNNEKLNSLFHRTNDLCAPFTSAWHKLDGQSEPVANVRVIWKKGKKEVFIRDPDYLVVFVFS